MANFTPVWPNYQYDTSGNALCPYTTSISPLYSSIYGIYNLNTPTQNITSNLVLNYSNILGDEIVYVAGSNNEVWAIRANGPKTETVIDETSVVWRKSLGFTATFLTISSDGESLYCVGDRYVRSLSTIDGSTNWTYDVHTFNPLGDAGAYCHIQIHIKEDSVGNLHLGVRDNYSYQNYLVKINSSGSYVESLFISNFYYGAFYIQRLIIKGNYVFVAYRANTAIVCEIKRVLASNYATSETVVTNLPGLDYLNYIDIVAKDSNIVYASMSSAYYPTYPAGVAKYDFGAGNITWTRPSQAEGSIIYNTVGAETRIYVRNGSTLQCIRDDGATYTDMWSTSILPSTIIANYPNLTIDANNKIYVASGNTSGSNIFVLLDNNTSGGIDQTRLLANSLTRTITQNPVIGSLAGGGLYYVPFYDTTSGGWLYILKPNVSPTTTTTTTSPTTTTTTTPSGPTTTTTTTTTLIPPTTTTTTTTPPPLAIVETSQFELVNGRFISVQTSNASDSSTTQNSLLSQALTFGTIAPSETSKTIVVALNIPYARAITNIKIGLVSSGGITFANNIFGITSSVELRDDITPDSYFQGVNVNKVSTYFYNIDIRNKDDHTSEYVYLSVKLPNDQIIGDGMIKYHWFFDYSE